MIYFYDSLVAKTLDTIKEAHDCADILNDLNRIQQAKKYLGCSGDWTAANQLDQELRQKYPCIDNMVTFTNCFPVPAPPVQRIFSASEAVIANLEQDYYGILCGTAIKKQLIHNIREFIRAVDNGQRG